MTPQRRSTDRGWSARLGVKWDKWGRDLTTFIAVLLAAYAVFLVQGQVDNIEQEGKERRHDTCTISEQKQRNDINALTRTYQYLAGLTPSEFAQPLNKAVLAGLPETVREAQTDDAPAFCDEPNVGLPEPDPKIPPRPKDLPGG